MSGGFEGLSDDVGGECGLILWVRDVMLMNCYRTSAGVSVKSLVLALSRP